MTDIAAFFAPTAQPIAAGAVAFAPRVGETTNEFAGLLAQFQTTLLQQPVTQNGALSLASPVSPGAMLGGEIVAGMNTAFELASGETGDQAVNADTTLAAQLAVLQNTLKSLQSEPQALPQGNSSPAAPTAKLGLRGSIAPAALEITAQQPPPDASARVQTSSVDTTLPPELLAAINNAKPTLQNAKAPAKAQATVQPPVDGVTHGQSTALAQAPKPAEDALNNNAFGSNTNSGAGTTGLAPQAAQPGTPAPSANPQAFAAAIAAAQPKLAETPNVTLSATPPAPAAVPLEALAVNIARKFDAGVSNFEISLHPAELGKLEISLSVADDGRIHAALRAERPETLDLLQRDARSLETQLRQAGLEVGSNALSFSLSQGNGQRQQHPFVGWPAFADAQATAGLAKEQALTAYVTVRDRDGVDIRV